MFQSLWDSCQGGCCVRPVSRVDWGGSFVAPQSSACPLVLTSPCPGLRPVVRPLRPVTDRHQSPPITTDHTWHMSHATCHDEYVTCNTNTFQMSHDMTQRTHVTLHTSHMKSHKRHMTWHRSHMTSWGDVTSASVNRHQTQPDCQTQTLPLTFLSNYEQICTDWLFCLWETKTLLWFLCHSLCRHSGLSEFNVYNGAIN